VHIAPAHRIRRVFSPFAIDSALQRVIAGARLQHCNCIEIDEVSAHSFLGIPYVSVSAHTRHIQKGMIFSGQ
jgi:hypothetical protein